jgi:hypothetical protein
MKHYVRFPNISGNVLTIIRRGLLIRFDPVFIHGMNDRSKITAYDEDSRGALFGWGVVAILMFGWLFE